MCFSKNDDETRLRCRTQGVDHIELSPEDTLLVALKAKICTAMGLPPALMPALALTNPKPLVPVSVDDSQCVVKRLDVEVMGTFAGDGYAQGEYYTTQESADVFVEALPAGGIELLRYAEEKQKMTAEDATMCSTLRLGPKTCLIVKLKPPREIPRSLFIVNGRPFQLSPEKSVGDLQALCATALSVPVECQALLVLDRPVRDKACSLGQLKQLLDQSRPAATGISSS